MLKINNIVFEIKSTEMNIKQRSYENESIITAEVMTEFFPKMVNGDVLSGAVDIKLDMSNIKSIGQLEGKQYYGKVGIVTLSVNKNGIWEHASVEDFDFSFIKRENNKFTFRLITKDPSCTLETTTTLVSLYTTNVDKLQEQFELSDFYDTPVVREIGKSIITKYYVKESGE